ncbi:uncharacterized protein LOC106869874 [Octopus bimaculoides]|nr:uncharacterized protein LOC106869874 [Octopus bimaculoides]
MTELCEVFSYDYFFSFYFASSVKSEVQIAKTWQAYRYLNYEMTQQLLKASLSEVEKKMISFLKLTQPSVDLKEAVMLDYFVAGIYWAHNQSYSNEQFSGFFSLLYDLQFCFCCLSDKHLTIGNNLQELRKSLAGIAVSDIITDCGGMLFFNLNAAKKIIEYFQVTLFQHYCLYEYIYTHMQAEQIIGTDLKIVPVIGLGPCFAPPLIEAVLEDSYVSYINLPPETELETDKGEVKGHFSSFKRNWPEFFGGAGAGVVLWNKTFFPFLLSFKTSPSFLITSFLPSFLPYNF